MPKLVLALLLFTAACSSPDEDVYGGGTFSVTFGDGAPLADHSVSGATQDCLDQHHRDWCNEPLISLSDSSEETDMLESFVVHAYLPVPASDPRPACLGDADLELIVYVVQHFDETGHAAWFELHDPVQTANEPNADQGGPRAPMVEGGLSFDDRLPVSASGSVSGTTELSGESGCDGEVSGTVDMTVTWDFDPSVTAGKGLYTLE